MDTWRNQARRREPWPNVIKPEKQHGRPSHHIAQSVAPGAHRAGQGLGIPGRQRPRTMVSGAYTPAQAEKLAQPRGSHHEMVVHPPKRTCSGRGFDTPSSTKST